MSVEGEGDLQEEFNSEYGRRATIQNSVCGQVYVFCGKCGLPLVPAPKGAGDVYPEFAWFESCCNAEPVYETDKGRKR